MMTLKIRLLTGSLRMSGWVTLVFAFFGAYPLLAQEQLAGNYTYETKPDDPEFAKFNPRLAPKPGSILLKKGDRLAIVGDSITEQKMYSRIVESYVTVCVPQLEITVRQYGWSGEKTDGFLRRMDRDCLRFQPTIVTLCYGMNDARYRPFDVTNGHWYRDHYQAIVRKLKGADCRVIVGSPGCAGKLATWVKSRSGTLDEHNLHLCALRDIALEVATQEQVAFADIFWPMYQAQVLAAKKYGTSETPYEVAGKDGIHPGWAGQVIMAYAFLRAMGLTGDIGTITLDLNADTAKITEGHVLEGCAKGLIQITSHRYPFCATGPIDRDDSIRSGMALVPFNAELNRMLLRIVGGSDSKYRVTWGEGSREYSIEQLRNGVNLAEDFPVNPFSAAFQKVDEAVLAKQSYETKQVKSIFHGPRGRENFETAVTETEAEQTPLAVAIHESFSPVQHSIHVEPIR